MQLNFRRYYCDSIELHSLKLVMGNKLHGDEKQEYISHIQETLVFEFWIII